MGTGYQIAKSLRFRAGSSALLSRTPGSAGNLKAWTASFWIKKSGLGISHAPFSAGTGGVNDTTLNYNTSDNLQFYNTTSSTINGQILSNNLFRDPATWTHIVASYDSANVTSSLRMVQYSNGVRTTDTILQTLPINTNSSWNNNVVHNIGKYIASGAFLDAYLAEFIFVDGLVLTPTSFGQTDLITGIWAPKSYSGSYGANGFRLDFSDNSSTTNLGLDRSGNGNNWTPSGISVTAGATNDSLTDTPTSYGNDTGLGGEVRGNYCTLTPLVNSTNGAGTGVPTNGNLAVAPLDGSWNGGWATFGANSGKWYYEVNPSLTNALMMVGWANPATANPGYTFGSTIPGAWVFYFADGSKYSSAGDHVAYRGSGIASTSTVGVAVDMDAGTITIYVDGVSQGVMYSSVPTNTFLVPCFYVNNSVGAYTGTFNFGQRLFANAAPTGYKALCTQNLPTPAIIKPSSYMDANLRVGTGSAGSVTGKGFQPDFVWSKSRTSVRSHMLANSVSGTGKYQSSDSTATEVSDAQSVTSFNTDGFSFGTAAILNTNTENFVDWLWKKSALSGVDIQNYVGTTSAQTVSHNLGAVPGLIIIKRRDTLAEAWPIYHKNANAGATGKGGSVKLNTTAAYAADTTLFNNVDPTSSVFSVGTSVETNILSMNFVAYLFAAIPGFSVIGSYTGNGSADGTFVWCGFKPRYFMGKRTDSTSNWEIFDTARFPFNGSENEIYANSNAAESGAVDDIDMLSNGFKLRRAASELNINGGSYIFAAFADVPFKYSVADASVFFSPLNPRRLAYLRR